MSGRITVPIEHENFGWSSAYSSAYGDNNVKVRVEYAVADTVPDTDSGDWLFMGWRNNAGNVVSDRIRAGSTVWIRARTERPDRRPSPWTTPVSVGIGFGYSDAYSSAYSKSEPVLYRLEVSVAANGLPSIAWEDSPTTRGLLVEYSVHTTGTTPLYENSLEIDAREPALSAYSSAYSRAYRNTWKKRRDYVLAGVSVDEGETLSVRVTPYTDFNDPDVEGIAGTALLASFEMQDAIVGSAYSTAYSTAYGS